jgi:hypothetical protein
VPFTILHVSDLHRAHDDPISNDELLSTLVADCDRIARESPSIAQPDAIVVSGDLVQGVGLETVEHAAKIADQYGVAIAFIAELTDRLLEGDRSRVAIVPGNHDVDWNVARSAMRAVEVDELPGRFGPALFSATTPGLEPAPPILRTETETPAKLLTVDEGEPAVYGYRCFIALSDRAREERGEFFLQPHSTAVVWGGQKVVFVFEHHSGEFGLYYDLQASHVVSAESGGGPFPTATIVLRDKIFIPVPESLMGAFMPTDGERKRFEVRSDLLYTERPI